MICQRCSKDVSGIHTCTPTSLVRGLEQRIKELEAEHDAATNNPYRKYCIQRDKELAASQAREQVLREGIRTIAATWISADKYDRLFFEGLLAPSDDTALRQWGAKLLREAADELDNHGEYSSACQLRRIAKELEDEK